jgi:dissimilatory sulfite reductase (desulfoviridin) alpha/beta subunit
VNELAELSTLDNTLSVIIRLTFQHAESRSSISAIGGVAAVVKAMKNFPKCQALQLNACTSLRNLALCSIGKANAFEWDGIKALLAAVNNHLVSAILCREACWALCNMVKGSKENVGLLITLGGGAAVAKVRKEWPDNNDVQTRVRRLANYFAAEWKACADKE